MDKNLSSRIKTQQDLKDWLEQSLLQLEQMQEKVDNLRAEGGARRLELAEVEIARLAEAGMPYDQAFEKVTAELEEREQRIKAQTDRERRERVEAQLEEMSEADEMRILQSLDEED